MIIAKVRTHQVYHLYRWGVVFKMDETFSFGTWLKRRRKGLGFTQEGLARQIGYSAVTIKKIESDDLQPSLQLAELIATHLQIPAHEREAFLKWARGGTATLSTLTDDTPWRVMPAPAAASVPRRVFGLPAQLTSVVGRERETEAACALLRGHAVRVLTLSGAPGIGKTRLALQIATELCADFADGVCFVPLAAVLDPALVPSAIAQALDVRELPGQALFATLQEFLRDKQLLLLLDNFEQVVQAATLVRDLLVTAPGLKVLITSRELLHLYGEQEFPVPPLEAPDIRALPSVERIAQFPAVALFVERAQAVKPDFALTPENAPVIAEMCAWLDGLPLGIEMAAARVKWLAPRALLARLRQRLALLTGQRDLSARQQTLRGAIDWSYDLLPPAERKLFTRFAVFVNGATLETAQAVLSGFPTPDVGDILAQLRSLVDKSLLRVVLPVGDDVAPRFTMLGTLREYALDKLAASGEVDLMRERHLNYYVHWAEQGEARLHGPDQIDWLERFESEHDNLRAALDWASQAGAVRQEAGLRLAGALGWFWRVHGHLSEGLHSLQAVLRDPTTGQPLRAKALSAAALLAYYQADYALSQALYEESVTLATVLADRAGQAYALQGLGNCYWYEGHQLKAQALLEQSVLLYRELNDQWGLALALSGLAGVLGYQGDYAASSMMFEESLSISAALGDKWSTAYALWNLGDVTYAQGDYERARTLYERSLPIARELGDKPNIAFVLAKLAGLAMQQGEYEHVGTHAQEALTLFREMGDQWQPPFLLRMQGYVALHEGCLDQAALLCKESLTLNHELRDERGVIACIVALACVAVAAGGEVNVLRAAQLFGAAQALLDAREMQLLPPDARAYALNVAVLGTRMSEPDFDTARAAGSAMTLVQASSLALELPVP